MEALYQPRDPLLNGLLQLDDYDSAYYRMRMMLDSFPAPQQELIKMWDATEQWNQFAQKHLRSQLGRDHQPQGLAPLLGLEVAGCEELLFHRAEHWTLQPNLGEG